jgi:hypothetical protein
MSLRLDIDRLQREVRRINNKICCLNTSGSGTTEPFSLFTSDSGTVEFSGSGTELDPLTAESLIAPIQNGIISGGEVTWISGYTYSVSPAVYYINGVRYEFFTPVQITLDPADLTNNRIDVFALTTDNTAVKITGIPSTNPEQPSINTATQLQTSFALVVANTTSPVGLSQEYIYRENAGTPSEWAASATGNIVVNSVATPNAGTISIEGTAVATGNAITLVRLAPVAIAATKNVLIFYIRSKATWNQNRILNFQFKNGVSNVGLTVPFSTGSYGFASSITGSYQRIVIPFSDFGLTPSDNVDRLVITAAGNGGTLGFYIDDIDTQGANLVNTPVGTTDNIGVFYVNRNYSGAGAATLSGYTLASITSTNAGYNAQLLAARMGDMNKAYPCPWSARNAAMEARTAGLITKAYIYVIGGNQWTIGSNVSANNGDANGVFANTAVADIGVTSGNGALVPNLMQNNIFYYFEPNTKITTINKTYAIHLGTQLVDATNNTPYRSGIYGKLNVSIFYVDTRFARINNSNAEIEIELDKIIGYNYFVVPVTYKRISVKATSFTGHKRSSLIGMSNGTSEHNGDGSPANLFVKVDEVYKGTIYYPYYDGSLAGSFQPLIATDAQSSTRQKNWHFEFGKVYIYGITQGQLFRNFVSSANRPLSNLNSYAKIDYLQFDVDTVDNAVATASYPMIVPISIGNTQSHPKVNTHFRYDIGTAILDNGLIAFQLSAPDNAGSSNNSITVNAGQVIRRAMYNVGAAVGNTQQYGRDSILTLGYLHVNSPTNTILGEKVDINVNIQRCVAQQGHCFGEFSTHETKNNGDASIYGGNVTIKGTYITEDGSSVIDLNGKGNACILDGVTLVAKGAATNSITVNNLGLPVSLYAKEAHSNLIDDGVATIDGTGLTVNANIVNYI